ncbi:hypothetical protein TVAG_009440 [Trichomonas vaginalis G3]|uniref:Uncharacterized protein n=1 Tax=Trichomonas vaginalis (strain ATCC PRA-98 / G3) TaxID=412133 RepID=A2G148_TRIV3|nr:hypothetical protein TVAG_009440 [Trichomonas vaginalis G3]|eukprot:XP_001302040.1 hypothetical protein [Trichomonas vaginalis G3]
MMNNFEYMPLVSGNYAYIRVDGVSTRQLPIQAARQQIVARVDPRSLLTVHVTKFTEMSHPNKTWEFRYNDPARSSLVLVLFQKHLFGGEEEISEVELRLSAFEPNTVVSEEFTLKSPHNMPVPARARISVHLSEDGSSAFCALAGGNILANPEIPHKATYFH